MLLQNVPNDGILILAKEIIEHSRFNGGYFYRLSLICKKTGTTAVVPVFLFNEMLYGNVDV